MSAPSAPDAPARGVIARVRTVMLPVLPGFAVVALGIAVGCPRALCNRAEAGRAFTARRSLSAGIVLLGFRLAFGDLGDVVGWGTLLVVVTAVVCTLLLPDAVELPPSLPLLTGTGFAICGATAVAAMCEVIDAVGDRLAFALALVTTIGSTAIFVHHCSVR